MQKGNASDLEWQTIGEGDARFRGKRLSQAGGGEELGCSLYELEPGDRSWPFHYHHANEEALFVLAGTGTLRWGADTVPLESGDYVPFERGEDGAHRVSNDGDDPLRYLLFSTMIEPDVTVYPDSEKVGVLAGAPPGGAGERDLEAYFRAEDAVDYWRDEG